MPLPMAIGTLPSIAVIGAAVATVMNSTPIRPTAFLRRRCTSWGCAWPACVSFSSAL
ncbi:hypothetical protein D3C79_917630 [compost metagenome]